MLSNQSLFSKILDTISQPIFFIFGKARYIAYSIWQWAAPSSYNQSQVSPPTDIKTEQAFFKHNPINKHKTIHDAPTATVRQNFAKAKTKQEHKPTQTQEQRQKAITNLVNQSLGEQCGIKVMGGYVFIKSPLFTGKRIITGHGLLEGANFDNEIDGTIGTLRNKLLYGTNTESQQAKNIIASEYKMHLRVKQEYLLPVVGILLEAFKNDCEILNLIHTIKVSCSDPMNKDQEGHYFPHIVIYSALGKENANSLLNKINGILIQSKLDLAKASDDIVPRFSRFVNPILSYTQSGGDFKLSFDDKAREKYFTDSMVHLRATDHTDKYALTITPTHSRPKKTGKRF